MRLTKSNQLKRKGMDGLEERGAESWTPTHRRDSGKFWNKDLQNPLGGKMKQGQMESGRWVYLPGGRGAGPGQWRGMAELLQEDEVTNSPGTWGWEWGQRGGVPTGEVRDPKGTF